MSSPAAPLPKVPPSLHWALVFLINMFTSGVFVVVWNFVQSGWIKLIDPKSTASRDYFLAIVLGLVGLVCFGILVGINVSADRSMGIAAGAAGFGLVVFAGAVIAAGIFHFKAIFGIRDSMVRYYNTVEPINLRLSAIMTFFFNVLYFQYHFTRIANWKRTGVLQPQT